MKTISIQSAVARKTANLQSLARQVANQPALLADLFDGLEAETTRETYGCLKLLRAISENHPAVLYPKIEKVFALLDNPRKAAAREAGRLKKCHDP